LNSLRLIGPDGEAVPLSFDPVGTDGAVLAQSTVPLVAGTYSVRGTASGPAAPTQSASAIAMAPAGGDQGTSLANVIVSATDERPTELGTIRVLDRDPCGAVSLDLQLSSAARTYASLLEISVKWGDSPAKVVVPYGTLHPMNGRATLSAHTCENGCLDDGSHSLTVSARIAGEEAPSIFTTTEVDVRCETAEPGCSLRPGSRDRDPSPWLVALGLSCLHRRRKSRLIR
jgi:hypothetical protein